MLCHSNTIFHITCFRRQYLPLSYHFSYHMFQTAIFSTQLPPSLPHVSDSNICHSATSFHTTCFRQQYLPLSQHLSYHMFQTAIFATQPPPFIPHVSDNNICHSATTFHTTCVRQQYLPLSHYLSYHMFQTVYLPLNHNLLYHMFQTAISATQPLPFIPHFSGTFATQPAPFRPHVSGSNIYHSASTFQTKFQTAQFQTKYFKHCLPLSQHLLDHTFQALLATQTAPFRPHISSTHCHSARPFQTTYFKH